MSRRDTIIIAVLVNAALLMILFATAVRSGDSKPETKKEEAVLAQQTQTPAPVTNHEDLLNEYVASVPTLAETKDEPLFAFEEEETTAPKLETLDKAVAVETPKGKIEGEFVHVTVKKGDYLEKIANANKTTIAAIVKANNLNSTQLKIGQVLKIPTKKGQGSTSTSTAAPESDFYVVRDGDNPWLIASRNKINLDELLRLNGLDEQKAKRLRPGDKLRIR